MGAAGGEAAAAPGAGGQLVRGFRILRVPMTPGALVSRNLLVKKHGERGAAEKPAESRTLFISHIDAFVTEAQLSRCFSRAFGPVERVELKSTEKKASKHEQRLDNVRNYVNFARVFFKEAAGLEKAMAASTGRLVAAAVLPPPPSVFKEQLRESKTMYRDPAVLRQEVDEWMVKYDEREEEKQRQEMENLVDEDGFTRVVAGTTRSVDGLAVKSVKRPEQKTGAFSEPVRGSQDGGAAGPKKKKEKERPDFYRFQVREKRREEIVDHRKRKVEDEEKVYHMRKAKKFKTG